RLRHGDAARRQQAHELVLRAHPAPAHERRDLVPAVERGRRMNIHVHEYPCSRRPCQARVARCRSIARMETVALGRSGLKVSRLALGCMSYGSSAWRPWVLDEEAARPFLRRALELGITFFDTADMYSLGRSEEVVGRALKDFAKRTDV